MQCTNPRASEEIKRQRSRAPTLRRGGTRCRSAASAGPSWRPPRRTTWPLRAGRQRRRRRTCQLFGHERDSTEVRIDRSEPHKKEKERAAQEREPPLTLFCLIYRQAKRAINRDRATDREERQSKGNAVAPPLAAARDAWGGDGGNDATVLSPPDPSVNEKGKKPQLEGKRQETGDWLPKARA